MLPGKFSLTATLFADGMMALKVNDQQPVTGKAKGLISVQPQDELSLGEDTRTAVGDYTAPHPLQGSVQNVKVVTQ